MTATRISTFTVEGPALDLFVSDCANCGIVFGIPKDLERRRRADKRAFYCPNGHNLVFGGKTDEQKLDEANARETALRDQLGAAIRDAEHARVQLLRDRQRYANGVCPCCNRYFDAVRRHMETQHPEYDAAAVRTTPRFKCGCGQSFKSFRGLRTHQGWQRGDDWDQPNARSWRRHLTVV